MNARVGRAPATSLKNIREAYGQISEMYGLEEIDVERSLMAAIETFFGTDNLWFSGDGLKIEGKYKTMRKYEFNKLYSIFMEFIKNEHNDSILGYVEQLMALNGNILYCEIKRYIEKDGVYLLRPLISKDRQLHFAVVAVKPPKDKNGNKVKFPDGLKRIPIYIEKPKKNANARSEFHSIKAKGSIMNKEVAQVHLENLNKRFKKKYDIDLQLEVVKSSFHGTTLEYTSAYTLPLNAIKIIGNYFRSFNVQAYINQNS